MRTTWALLILTLFAASCDSPAEPVACTDIAFFGIQVEAVDVRDGSPVNEGLAGTIIDGAFFEELQVSGSELFGALERPGVYAVTVTATGFEPWIRTEVAVEEGVCHVEPVELTAEMEAA